MTRVFLSLGSNVERDRNLRSSIEALHREFAPLSLSSVYESAPVGFTGDDFYNMAVGFDTDMPLEELREFLRSIENLHGRLRDNGKLGPRPLDIDLLLYGDLVRHDGDLDLPRGEIAQYAFVLLPLSEIAPELVHPEAGETMSRMWRNFNDPDQAIHRVEFEFAVHLG